MPSVTPYIMFNGNCEEAMEFYADALDGDIISMQRYGESQPDTPEEFKNRIMHSVIAADDVVIMASDGMPTDPRVVGTNISLSLDFESLEEQQETFDALAEGGSVTMPLQDTFWGARFGMLTDKFGIGWMFNYDVEEEDEDEEEEEESE
jgi:PhnB protein